MTLRRRPRHVLDASEAVRVEAAAAGGGAFLGLDPKTGAAVHVPAECAALVIAPPRGYTTPGLQAGKTSSVAIPSVVCAPGATVVTSTKPDVLTVTGPARSRLGTVWVYDPTGQADDLPDGVTQLRWSPVHAARRWALARRLASEMVAAAPANAGPKRRAGDHWASRAGALLAPLLYTAARTGGDIFDVLEWVLSGSAERACELLRELQNAGDQDAVLAGEVLAGVEQAPPEERGSIWSAAADTIDAYVTSEALTVATEPNWDPDEFVRSSDTVYILASAVWQTAAAPLVVALLEAVRDAQYRRHRAEAFAGVGHGPVTTFVLDEVANIAPIASLPAMVSEAGSQGLHVIAIVQDLSQVRTRWGVEAAEGFLTLFQHVLVLGGVRDPATVAAIDRVALTDVSRLRAPAGLHLHGCTWQVLELAPYFRHPRWQAALAAAHEAGEEARRA